MHLIFERTVSQGKHVLPHNNCCFKSHQYFINLTGFIERRCHKYSDFYFLVCIFFLSRDTIINWCLALARRFMSCKLFLFGIYWKCSIQLTRWKTMCASGNSRQFFRNSWRFTEQFHVQTRRMSHFNKGRLNLKGKMEECAKIHFVVENVSVFAADFKNWLIFRKFGKLFKIKLHSSATLSKRWRETHNRELKFSAKQITKSIRWWSLGVINWISLGAVDSAWGCVEALLSACRFSLFIAQENSFNNPPCPRERIKGAHKLNLQAHVNVFCCASKQLSHFPVHFQIKRIEKRQIIVQH